MSGPIPLPDLNLKVDQTAQSGAGGGNAVGGATSDWVVTYGAASSVSKGFNVPTWVWVALAVAGVLYMKKRG